MKNKKVQNSVVELKVVTNINENSTLDCHFDSINNAFTLQPEINIEYGSIDFNSIEEVSLDLQTNNSNETLRNERTDEVMEKIVCENKHIVLKPEMIAIENQSDWEITKKIIKINWKKHLFNFSTHVGSTTILVSTKFWNPYGLIPRLLSALLGPGIIVVFDCYITAREKKATTAEIKKLKFIKESLKIVATCSSIDESFCFNIKRVPELKYLNQLINKIILDKIFWNEISKYFTIEQIISFANSLISIGLISCKIENTKMSKYFDMIQNLIRQGLIITGFAIVSYAITKDDQLELWQKVTSVSGLHIACLSTYLSCLQHLKKLSQSVCQWLKCKLLGDQTTEVIRDEEITTRL